jgi:hypothetical protein
LMSRARSSIKWSIKGAFVASISASVMGGSFRKAWCASV